MLLLSQGRSKLQACAGPALSEQPRTIDLGRFGIPINIFGVIFAIFTSVFFIFPPELPVTGSNMNYLIVVLAIVFFLALFTWIFGGRKSYTGPKNIELLLERAQAARTDSFGTLGMSAGELERNGVKSESITLRQSES